MENQLIKKDQLPIQEIMSIAKAFAESGMFADTKSAAQAIVKIQAGQEIGIPPFAAMTGIHIIQGKPIIGAGLIASRVKGSGKYDYDVEQMDDKACVLSFYQTAKDGSKKELGKSSFTIEDARKAGTKNLDKFPKNMLFARAVSNGVKWFCADVFSGPVYTPEEFDNTSNITIDTDATIIEDTPKTTMYNHNVIGEENKPLINNEQFKKVIDRLKNGEIEIYQKTIDTFSLVEAQNNLLNNTLRDLNRSEEYKNESQLQTA